MYIYNVQCACAMCIMTSRAGRKGNNCNNNIDISSFLFECSPRRIAAFMGVKI